MFAKKAKEDHMQTNKIRDLRKKIICAIKSVHFIRRSWIQILSYPSVTSVWCDYHWDIQLSLFGLDWASHLWTTTIDSQDIVHVDYQNVVHYIVTVFSRIR